MARTMKVTMLLLALCFTFLLAVPAHAGFGFLDERGGPIYTSPRAIEDAQTILERSRYLTAGSYRKGERDQATINAIREFQREHFLRPTGMLDTETMGLLTTHQRQAGFATSMPEQTIAMELMDKIQRDREQGRTGPGTALARGGQRSGGTPVARSSQRGPAPVGQRTSAQGTRPGSARVARTMPETDSPVAFLAGLGGLLLVGGLALLYGRRF